MKIAIFYSSVDGQTKRISKFIKKELRNRCSVDLYDIEANPKTNLSHYKFIVIGASIRYGNYRKHLFNFINSNLRVLNNKKSAFFSVNIVARKLEKSTPSTNPYIEKFVISSKWSPLLLDVFAGKLDYPKYNFFNKKIIQFIMFVTKGPTDTSQTYYFTDWSRVRLFAEKIYTSLNN